MAGVNKVILVGNLGQDPQSRSFQNGGKVVNLRIATSETWKDKQTGERKEKTEWHSVAIFNEGLANTAERYLRKGSKVYIEGKLQTRKWQGQDGQDKYSTEVVLQGFDGTLVMLDGPGGGAGRRRALGAETNGVVAIRAAMAAAAVPASVAAGPVVVARPPSRAAPSTAIWTTTCRSRLGPIPVIPAVILTKIRTQNCKRCRSKLWVPGLNPG